MKSIRDSFVKRFGITEALAIENAAEEHKNGVHDYRGSDPFKWALLICIGYQCMEKDVFRKHHKIKTPFKIIKSWIKKNGKLKSHDGQFDYISLMAGTYNEYV